jgi:hypothetical protein
MSWGKVKDAIGKAAPLVGSLLGGRAGETVGAMVASVLGVEARPDAVEAALASNPDALLRLRDMEMNHQRELVALQAQASATELQAESARLAEINATMRAEAASDDAYVRRWRPTFGYAVALTWTLTTLGIVYAIVAEPKSLQHLADVMSALTIMWGTALAVLGVQVQARSTDKQVAAGVTPPPGLLGALASRVAGRAGTGNA